jgi:hypothetical protein
MLDRTDMTIAELIAKFDQRHAFAIIRPSPGTRSPCSTSIVPARPSRNATPRRQLDPGLHHVLLERLDLFGRQFALT